MGESWDQWDQFVSTMPKRCQWLLHQPQVFLLGGLFYPIFWRSSTMGILFLPNQYHGNKDDGPKMAAGSLPTVYCRKRC
jgi:hypothetical protein